MRTTLAEVRQNSTVTTNSSSKGPLTYITQECAYRFVDMRCRVTASNQRPTRRDTSLRGGLSTNGRTISLAKLDDGTPAHRTARTLRTLRTLRTER